jgi:hypothetical protein|tara:strand:- start:3451 stop:4053 length:603 start_codon:yes stop_codon:yes gene_type:complete
MHYVRKETLVPGLVADADGVMREFYRADETVNNLDQNNFASSAYGTNGINFDTAYSPADSPKLACTRTHDASGNLLYVDGVNPATTKEVAWTLSSQSVSFTSTTTSWYTFYSSGTVQMAASPVPILRADVAFFLNGQLMIPYTSVSAYMAASTIKTPYFVSTSKLLEAGTWTIQVGLRQFGSSVPASISGGNIAAVGWVR